MSNASKKHYNIPRLKLYNDLHDSGTQTSKTILQLANMEVVGTMSPDSLMSSPRNCDSLTNLEQDTLLYETPLKQHEFNRRQYLYNEKTPTDDRNNKSLIEMFLAKSNNKARSTCDCTPNNENRAKFLQQTSPLRYISKHTVLTLKSQSYIEPNCRRDVEVEFETHPVRNRFVVKKVKEYTETDETKPVKYFCPKNIEDNRYPIEVDLYSPKINKECCSSKRGSSFMCPTISSENKNKLPEVQCLNKLISPTRRGRSYSPSEKRGESKHKIPYIDQSQESCVCKESGFAEPKMSVKKTEFQIPEIKVLNSRPSPFEEDLLKIDQLSLNMSSEV